MARCNAKAWSVANLTSLSAHMKKQLTPKNINLVLDESYDNFEAGQSKNELLSRARNAIASLRNKHHTVAVLADFFNCSQPKKGRTTRAGGLYQLIPVVGGGGGGGVHVLLRTTALDDLVGSCECTAIGSQRSNRESSSR